MSAMNLPPAPPGAVVDPEMMSFHGADGVEIKFMQFPRGGSVIAQHVHAYDHTAFIFGSADIWCDGEHLAYLKNDGVLIKAGRQHMIVTRAPGTWLFCIHNVMRSGHIELKD